MLINNLNISVDTKDVEQIQFPAVSVCRSLSWTWPGIANYMSHIDSDGKYIKNTVSQLSRTWDIIEHVLLSSEECKDILESSETFTKDTIDMLNDDQLKGVGFINYVINQILI